MCRLAALKSTQPLSPVLALRMMQAMQKGHDNSGFAMVMQDLEGAFADFKKYPLLSMACTSQGLEAAEEILETLGFTLKFDWQPDTVSAAGLDFRKMPHYVFRNYRYPEAFQQKPFSEQKALLVQTRLHLRQALAAIDGGFVYSFWPDVLTLKEIGNPSDIGTYFDLWREESRLTARVISAQCRQNTNYKIVRYAAHPFFLEGYTLMANGENTNYQRNKEFQQNLHPGYLGFESDSQCFLYTLHYIREKLAWPLKYYKHVITPLPFEEMRARPDADILLRVRQACSHLEINGPNTIIFVLPAGEMGLVTDAKKLRPVVIGRHEEKVITASEVCGVDMVIPQRDPASDIYPSEREMLLINNQLEIEQWIQ